MTLKETIHNHDIRVKKIDTKVYLDLYLEKRTTHFHIQDYIYQDTTTVYLQIKKSDDGYEDELQQSLTIYINSEKKLSIDIEDDVSDLADGSIPRRLLLVKSMNRNNSVFLQLKTFDHLIIQDVTQVEIKKNIVKTLELSNIDYVNFSGTSSIDLVIGDNYTCYSEYKGDYITKKSIKYLGKYIFPHDDIYFEVDQSKGIYEKKRFLNSDFKNELSTELLPFLI